MPVDFSAIIARAKEGGAFSDYPQPLNSASEYAVPIRYPGEAAYKNGPALMAYYDAAIPQATIKANHRSFKEMVNHFMPPDAVAAFMRDYFAGNFLKDKHFKEALSQFRVHEILPSEEKYFASPLVTRRLGADALEERLRLPRRPFSPEEYAITHAVCRKQPQLVGAVIAFNAALVSYVDHLQAAMQKDGGLTGEERVRALKQMEPLREGVQASLGNMTRSFVPAIALQYDGRVRQDHAQPMDAEDFKKGLQWAQELKVFDNQATEYYSRETRSFRCPAKAMLLRASALDLQASAGAAPDYAQQEYGRLLAGIAQKIDVEAARHPRAVKGIYKTIRDECALHKTHQPWRGR